MTKNEFLETVSKLVVEENNRRGKPLFPSVVIAQAILDGRRDSKKPIIVVNMGGPSFEDANELLRENHIPTYVFPETAVDALAAMTKFAKLGDREYDDVVEKISDVDNLDGNRIFITNSGNCEEIEKELEQIVREVYPDKEIILNRAGCTVSSHCGPGTLGILMIRKRPIE